MKEAIFIQDGKKINYVAQETISVGDLIVVGDIVGVAFCTALEGESVTLMIEGVFEIAKDSAIGVGSKVYFDTDTRKATTDNTKVYIGKAIEETASVVNVKINI